MWQNFSEEFVSLMDAHEIKGVDIIFMITLLMKNGLLNNVLEPKNIFESEYFSVVEDYSQYIHDGLMGSYGLIKSPLLQFEVLRFTHEVLQIMPKTFKSKSPSDGLSKSFTFNKVSYRFKGVWKEHEMKYEISLCKA